MKITVAIRKFFKIIAWTVMAVLLLVGAILMLVYSPWSQDAIRRYAVVMLRNQGIDAHIETLALHFPLNIELGGVSVAMPDGEAIKAGSIAAGVEVLPLLGGVASVPDVRIGDAAFSMGSPDTTMYLAIKGDALVLRNTRVGLKDMDIDVNAADISGGRFSLTINPDTTKADTTAAAPPTAMKVKVNELILDDFAFEMRMLPTIDTLQAAIPHGLVEGIAVDLLAQTVDLKSFTGTGLGAKYLVPDSATIAATPVVPPSTDSVAPWTINIDTIGFSDSHALYTTVGVSPLPGLDFSYIEVDSTSLGISHFYNQAANVHLPLNITATERCGVTLTATGTLDISETAMTFKDFNVSTPNGTALQFSGMMGSGDMTTDPSLPLALTLDGRVAPVDASLMFPAFGPYFNAMGPAGDVYATIDLGGTAGDLAIDDFSLLINSMVRLKAHGAVRNAFDPQNIGGHLDLSGAIINVNRLKPLLFDKATAKQINIPPTTLAGSVNMNAGDIAGKLKATTHKGTIALDADWHQRAENYKVNLTTSAFPVDAFLPLMGIGEVSATLAADGHGYDPFKASMKLHSTLVVSRAVYNGYDYKGISARADIADGKADIHAGSINPNARFTLDAAGNLAGDTYDWDATLDGQRIDLKALGMSTTDAVINATLAATATITPKTNTIDGTLALGHLNYTTQISSIAVSDINATFHADDSITSLGLRNRDLTASLTSPMMLDSVMGRLTRVSDIIAYEADAMKVNIDTLQRALPPFTMTLKAGPNNAIGQVLSASKTFFNSINASVTNDSLLNLEASMLGLRTPSMRLDTITFDMHQRGTRLIIDGRIDNRPGTFDEWAHVALDGAVGDNILGLQVRQSNIKGKEGYRVGLFTTLADSSILVSVQPTDPVIAYMPWTVNDSNYIMWNIPRKHLDANLRMRSATSSLNIYTNHVDGDEENEELVVDISDIHISEWVKLNPFAPAISGDLSADMRVHMSGNTLNGKGYVQLTDFTYDRERVGTMRADLNVSTDLTGRINADADLSVDGHRSLTLSGALNDSTAGSPLAMDLSLIHFPLDVVNPFLGADLATVRGTLMGSMDVSGDAANPRLDGWLQFDSTAVKLAMTGSWYEFNNVKIPVEESVVKFNDFGVGGLNDNPLTVNGTVDIRDFANPTVDLALAASNMQLLNTSRLAKGADIYGRAFINLGATVKGNMRFMAVDADLSLLSGSTIYYVMPDAENVITNRQTDDMVTFVNFADTPAVELADSITQSAMALLLDASLTLQTGSTINIDLSSNGRDRVSLQPNGTVEFSMKPFGQPRLTGRINIPKGYVRYTPPFMSEKNFSFDESSYVAFNGNMLNPILNVHAVDVVKANVTQTGQNSRLVNFDVGLNVTGTLENMNVAFDLSTQDDITVANELQSMSPEQRANQAMNMLLYNVYSGPGTRGDSMLSGNPVYSFLTSQLNNWAANTIKGVDLSFGVDQYDRTVDGSTSQTTSYSYQVSKSLFNDRFKIVVGGNYSTDTNADENFSQNLIKDISFEYFLNKAQTMYVSIFRHTGYESILEGEITRTGVGFVYKHRSPSFRGLFLRRHRRRHASTTVTPDSASGVLPATENASKQ